MRETAAEKRDASAHAWRMMVKWIKPGDTVWTIVRHVSRSGMSRDISAFVIVDGEPLDVSGYIGRVLNWPRNPHTGAVKVSGCGMDMGFHLVYSLSATLFPNGFGCTGDKCPSADHSNGDRNRQPHCSGYDKNGKPNGKTCNVEGCNGAHWHKNGGYALRQRWL